MKTKIFIDGREGTTGLQIEERLSRREELELLRIDEDKRKDADERRKFLNAADLVFLCLPDAAAIEAVSLCESKSTVIIDASTAHRTNKDWEYGFPELSEEREKRIAASKRIANPGCHASGFISLVYPLTESGILSKKALLSCFSVTGYSGGGKKMIADYEAKDRDILLSSPRQYGISQSHKHLPEMTAVCGLETPPLFSPIVADFYSGMTVTVPLFAEQINGTAEDIKRIYKEKYAGPIVRYADAADENGFISSNRLSGKDSMEISVFGNSDRILLVSRYDNLGKGASGAAVECMNIVIGADKSAGLEL